MEELFIKEILLFILYLVAISYLIGLTMIWLIVIMDKERKSIHHKPKRINGRVKPSIDDINKGVDGSTFINLQGQDVDEVDEVFSISKPKVKRKVSISKNQENVSNMSAYEINQYLKNFGIISELTDEQKGTLLVEYLDGTEIGNLRKLYSDGEFELLRKYGKARINIHPNEIVPHIILVRSYFKMKKYEDCINQCDLILSFEPNYLDAFRFIARAHRAMGMDEKAAMVFKKLAELAWDDIDSRFSLMKHYWNKREYIIAQGYIEELLQLAPDEIRYHVYSGRILQRLQQFEKAIDRWNSLLALDPDNIDALLGLGQSYYGFEDPNRGLKFLLIANEINRDDSRILKAMIQIYISLGLMDKALNCLEEQCINYPLEIGYWTKRISLVLRTYGDSLGNSLLEKVIQTNSDSLEGYYLAIILANDFSLNEKGEEFLSITLSKFQNHFDIHLELSKRFIKSDFIGKAFLHLKEAQKISSQDNRVQPVKQQIDDFLDEIEMTKDIFYNEGEINSKVLKTDLIFSKIIEKCQSNVNIDWKFERKVAMVSSTLGRGGAERQVVACLSGLSLAKEWADVKLFCNIIDNSKGKYRTFEKEVLDLGISILEYGSQMEQISTEIKLNTEIDKLLDLLPLKLSKSIRILANEFSLYKPSIVHSWQDGMNIIAAIAAFISGVPSIIMFARSLRPDQKTIMHTYNKKYYKGSYKSILESPRALLVHNSKTGLDSYANWLEMKGTEFKVIYNGIDFEKVLKVEPNGIQDILTELNLPLNAFIIGSVFRIVDEKQPRLWVETAIQIIKEKKDVHFILVGGGALFETLRKEIKDAGFSENIHLVGQSKVVASWLDFFDLFLLTSRVEGLPNVLIEAQMMGLPVISTDAGGANETFIDGETGYLCMDATSSSLSKIITSVMNDELWMMNASFKAKEVSKKKFGQKEMIDTLLNIYEDSI